MIRVRHFRYLAAIEAFTGVLLAMTLVAKYGNDDGRYTSIIGPIHGVVFLAYFASVLALRNVLRWRIDRIVVALAAAFIPLGTYFVVERVEDWPKLQRREARGAETQRRETQRRETQRREAQR